MSEFGTGFAYPLGLFLAHADRVREDKKIYEKIGDENRGADMWFYAACDHLFELEIPEKFSPERKAVIADWLRDTMSHRLDRNDTTWQHVETALQFAKDLLLEWDILCGIKAEKGDYE